MLLVRLQSYDLQLITIRHIALPLCVSFSTFSLPMVKILQHLRCMIIIKPYSQGSQSLGIKQAENTVSSLQSIFPEIVQSVDKYKYRAN